VKVVIMGCGRVGSHVATELWQQRHRVTVLDTVPESFLLLPPEMVEAEETTLVGDGTLEEDLVRAGIQGADLFIAVSLPDNRNALAAQKAQHLFHVSRVVCRIGDPVRQEMYEKLGLQALSPTRATSSQILEATQP
jgi:trk system potassium uptake protein TrkA